MEVVPVFYFLFLVGITIKDSLFARVARNNNTEHHNFVKILHDVLIIAGALWLWSNIGVFFIGVLASLIGTVFLDHLELDLDINLSFRLFVGVLWWWSNKKLLLFASIFACVIYANVLTFRDNRNPPIAQDGVSVPNRGEEGTSSGGVSIRQPMSSRSATVGQNVNGGGGIQTIGGVRIGDSCKIAINICRDVFVTIVRSLKEVFQ